MQWQYNNYNLNKIAKFNTQGQLPYMYCKPKSKDPINKVRVITSQFKHPMRRILKYTSKVLRWMFRMLPQHIQHFTLHKMHDFQTKAKQLNKKLKNIPRTLIPLQTDVTQMYTNLDHELILRSISWLFKNIQQIRSHSHNLRPQKTWYVSISKTKPYTCTFSAPRINTENITFSEKDIKNIIDIDLTYSYASAGQTIYKQIIGCPMGGYLSGVYADLTCAYCEYTKLHKNIKHITFSGYRQMDDLLYIQQQKKKTITKQTKARFNKIMHNTYTGGLTLEKQNINHTNNIFSLDFIGTKVTINNNNHSIHTHIDDTNYINIFTTGEQKKKRFHNYESYLPKHCKIGTIVGALQLAKRSSTHPNLYIYSAVTLLTEFIHIGYPMHIITKAIKKHTHNRNHQKIITSILTQSKQIKPFDENMEPTNFTLPNIRTQTLTRDMRSNYTHTNAV